MQPKHQAPQPKPPTSIHDMPAAMNGHIFKLLDNKDLCNFALSHSSMQPVVAAVIEVNGIKANDLDRKGLQSMKLFLLKYASSVRSLGTCRWAAAPYACSCASVLVCWQTSPISTI